MKESSKDTITVCTAWYSSNGGKQLVNIHPGWELLFCITINNYISSVLLTLYISLKKLIKIVLYKNKF